MQIKAGKEGREEAGSKEAGEEEVAALLPQAAGRKPRGCFSPELLPGRLPQSLRSFAVTIIFVLFVP